MFDLGWQELILIAVIAIIVISPKDLPQAIRAVSQSVRQLRSLSREFRSGVSELVREAELDELKRQIDKTGSFDHLNDLSTGSDPTSSLAEDFDPRQLARDLKRRVNPESPSPVGGAKRLTQSSTNPAVVEAADRSDLHEQREGEENPLSGRSEEPPHR